MAKRKPELKVRKARMADAGRIAELSGQLGYVTEQREMSERLAAVRKDRNAACFVADGGNVVVGWVHVSVTALLEVQRRAEVNGLIVDEQLRSRGAGWKLLQAAEQWARKMNCNGMSVRSNVVRERAHQFYSSNGYEHFKTQKAFRKGLQRAMKNSE